MELIRTDILIVGAGITGTAVARELSRYHASVCVAEKAGDISEGATKANSGIIHAGYDAVPGTLKAKYNVRGAEMYPELCKTLSVPYRKCGAMVVAFSDSDTAMLETLKERGKKNGVPGLRMILKPELSHLEPNLNPEAVAALDVPSSAIISPYEMAFALADDAAMNEVRFFLNEEVVSVQRSEKSCWTVNTRNHVFLCRSIINCAGSHGADLHRMITGKSLNMIHRRGQYYLLDRLECLPFSRTIFQCPTRMGKGVLISPTVHGNLIIGPNAEDITDPEDTSTTSAGLDEVMKRASLTWPSLSVRNNITNFSGVRAHLDTDDFMVGELSGYPGIFEAIGIESPGLSSAPAIAEDLTAQAVQYLSLTPKTDIVPYPVVKRPFHDMTEEERRKVIAEDPLYGNIICRCEMVTEAEIRSAIHRPVGATTIDGIKRRTRTGMGRCQGGFCSPRVASILAEELHVSPGDICKGSSNSRILTGTIQQFLKAGVSDD